MFIGPCLGLNLQYGFEGLYVYRPLFGSSSSSSSGSFDTKGSHATIVCEILERWFSGRELGWARLETERSIRVVPFLNHFLSVSCSRSPFLSLGQTFCFYSILQKRKTSLGIDAAGMTVRHRCQTQMTSHVAADDVRHR